MPNLLSVFTDSTVAGELPGTRDVEKRHPCPGLRITVQLADTLLRAWYAQNLIDNAQYVIANPCLTLDSETNNLMGATLNQEVEDAQVQYIAGKIDLEGLKAVYADWYAQGGDMILEEFQAAYDARK